MATRTLCAPYVLLGPSRHRIFLRKKHRRSHEKTETFCIFCRDQGRNTSFFSPPNFILSATNNIKRVSYTLGVVDSHTVTAAVLHDVNGRLAALAVLHGGHVFALGPPCSAA